MAAAGVGAFSRDEAEEAADEEAEEQGCHGNPVQDSSGGGDGLSVEVRVPALLLVQLRQGGSGRCETAAS